MKFRTYITAVLFSIALFTQALGQVTESPRVEERSVQDVSIKKVELTDQYTIIYLQYIDRQREAPGLPFPGMKSQGASIWLDPETRLYKPGEINTKFKLIKAENIPTKSDRMPVKGGQVVDFVAYFERLTPGIEVFDFYEGRATNPGERTWNFYGVHIKNPKNRISEKPAKLPEKPKPVTPEKAEPLEKPREPELIENPEELDEKRMLSEPSFGQLQGTVYDAVTNEPLTASIQYVENGDSLTIYSSSGSFRVGVDLSKTYSFQVAAKGYFGESLELNPKDSSGHQLFNKNIYLRPIQVGASMAMGNIYFETGKYGLLPESFPELQRLLNLMKDNPGLGIRIEGHTDNVGDFDKNLELSKQRAEAVKGYLVSKGVKPERIEARGYGSTRPIAKDQSEAERSRNRRVEVVITQE
ncbi:OmpA family protein [Dyadobacter tibetensis]|uniref:OmpA family protein n=1 Tax=Dyadobacter tibetensis TaxID=1211851 RepID=UPI00047158CF|nr:OmpA family protein [Dyadobacter tibetensis]